MRICERAREDRLNSGEKRERYAAMVMGRQASYMNVHRWERPDQIRPMHVYRLALYFRMTRDEIAADVADRLRLSVEDLHTACANDETFVAAVKSAGWSDRGARRLRLLIKRGPNADHTGPAPDPRHRNSHTWKPHVGRRRG